MKFEIFEDSIEIKLGFRDRHIKKIYRIIFGEKLSKYSIKNDFLENLYKEDPEILEKLGFNIDFEQIKLKINYINNINLNTIEFYFKNYRLKLQNRFLVNREKGIIIYLFEELYDLITSLDSKTNLSKKLQKLCTLEEKYKIKIEAPKEFKKVDYSLKVDKSENGVVIDYTIYGLPRNNRILQRGTWSTKSHIYFLEDEKKADLELLEKYRDSKVGKILINEKNIDSFYEDYQLTFSEEFVKRLSDRIKFLTFVPKNVSIKKNLTTEISSEFLDYNIIQLQDLVEGGVDNIELTDELKKLIEDARKKNKRFVFYNDSWIKIDSMPHFEGTENLKPKTDLTERKEINSQLFDIQIKENLEELEYFKVKDDSRELIEKRLELKYFNGDLKEFQKTGVMKIIAAYLEGFRGFLLADDMGLGKTAQAIAFMTWLYENRALFPVLIAVPDSLISNWKDEISKFSPELGKFIDTGDLEIINYEKLFRRTDFLVKDWNLIITDEAQRYKNYRSKISRIIKGYKFKFHLALTGTPVENSIDELWNIIDAIVPGFLGKLKDFNDRYNIINIKPDSVEAEEKSLEILNTIDPIFLRRTKFDKSVNIHFPEKQEFKIDCSFTDIQEEIYLEKYQQYRFIDGRKNFLGLVIKLLQVCDFAADDFNSDFLKYSGKLKGLKEILLNIKDRKEKVLIFTKFLLTQRILKTFIESEIGMNCEIFNGTLSREEQNQVINRFNRDLVDVLIINPRVGGVGLNLVKANHVIHFTPEWNPAVTSQATDRAYRIGQNKKVFVYYFYSKFKNSNKKTVEEYFMKLLDRKNQIKNILLDNIAINKEFEKIQNEFLN